MSITQNDLMVSYQNGRQQLIPLLIDLRTEDYRVKRSELDSSFTKTAGWEKKDSGGHAKFQHKVTHIIVEYQSHGPQTIKKNIQNQVLENVQNHMNILANEIFQYQSRNWKDEPNYETALRNYHIWENIRRNH